MMSIHRSKRIREQIEDLVTTQFKYQQDQLTYKLTLAFDEDKKRLFGEYLVRIEETHGSIVYKSNQMIQTLKDTMHTSIVSALEQAHRHNRELECLKEKGIVDDTTFQHEKDRVADWSRVLRDDVVEKVRLIAENHAKAIEKTVALFEANYVSAV